MDFTSSVVVFRRIWREEPILGVLFVTGRLQLVLALRRSTMRASIDNENLILFTSRSPFVSIVSIVDDSSWSVRATQRGKAYPEDSGCRPLTLLPSSFKSISQLHVDSKPCIPSMTIFTLFTSPWTHFKGLRDDHPALVSSETVKPL